MSPDGCRENRRVDHRDVCCALHCHRLRVGATSETATSCPMVCRILPAIHTTLTVVRSGTPYFQHVLLDLSSNIVQSLCISRAPMKVVILELQITISCIQ